ncbi:maker248, partial [Drosophila busckii]
MDSFVDFKNLTLEEIIGRGVYKATWKKPNGSTMTIAAKLYYDDYNQECWAQVYRMVRDFLDVSHENITKFYGFYNPKELFVLWEYAENGSLYDYIHNSGRTHSFELLTNYMYQCAKGLAYLHGRQPQILQRKLRTSKLLLSKNYSLLKICDAPHSHMKSIYIRRISPYDAPEVITRSGYDENSETFSFGIVLWEVMAQKDPFVNWRYKGPHTDNRQDINEIKNFETSAQIKQLIELCWKWEQSERPLMKSLEDKLFNLTLYMKGMYSNVDSSAIELKKVLGQGSFGKVFEAFWSGMTVAVKRISYDDEKCKQVIDKEARFLSTVRHDNIIKLYGISHDTSPLGKRMLLLMEYAENGSLEAYIHSGRDFAYEDLLNLMRQCVKGLAYLHGSQPSIMHRDVKTANMVLTDDYSILKICDFGLVKSVASKNTELIGSIPYRAPEIYNTKEYDEKCDVYSFGIVLWEVMSQKKPFENCNIVNIMNQVLLQ